MNMLIKMEPYWKVVFPMLNLRNGKLDHGACDA